MPKHVLCGNPLCFVVWVIVENDFVMAMTPRKTVRITADIGRDDFNK